MSSIIAWFFSLMLIFFTYTKLFNLKRIKLLKIFWTVLFSFGLVVVAYFVEPYIPFIRFIIMILLSGIFIRIMTNTKIDLAVAGFALAFGIVYAFGLLSHIPVFSVVWLIVGADSDVLVAFLAPLLQFILIYLLFSIRRMRKGMPFLKDRGAGVVGLIISSIILTTAGMLPNQNFSHEFRLLLVVSALVSVAGIIIWWRKGLTKLYKKTVQQRYLQDLEEKHAKLVAEAERMATLFHRDNKLLAALYESAGISGNTALQSEIDALMQDRMIVMKRNQQTFSPLPNTKNELLNGVLESMRLRALEHEINLELTLFNNITDLLEIIAPLKLGTLLADLLENAIIATAHSDHRRIRLTFGLNNGFHEFTMQDSGIPFAQHTLEKLGQERASTHLHEGGSGIGYMTIFEILREYQASLIITQHPAKKFHFTKAVTVRFDGKGDFTVN